MRRDASREITVKDVPALDGAAAVLTPGTRVHLPHLAGETREERLAAARTVADHGLVPVLHVAARRLASREELLGVPERVFLVGGDPATPHGPFPDALSVLASGLLQEAGAREVGLAGYPQGHPGIADDVLATALRDKLSAAADAGMRTFVITQLCFDAAAVAAWIARLRGEGVIATVRVGVPSPAGPERLLGFARRCGVAVDAARLEAFDPDRFVEDLAQELAGIDAGDVRLHVYTIGRPAR